MSNHSIVGVSSNESDVRVRQWSRFQIACVVGWCWWRSRLEACARQHEWFAQTTHHCWQLMKTSWFWWRKYELTCLKILKIVLSLCDYGLGVDEGREILFVLLPDDYGVSRLLTKSLDVRRVIDFTPASHVIIGRRFQDFVEVLYHEIVVETFSHHSRFKRTEEFRWISSHFKWIDTEDATATKVLKKGAV